MSTAVCLQLVERTSATAFPQLFKGILVRTYISTHSQSQLFQQAATWSPQLFNECWSATAYPHSCNRIFSTVRNFWKKVRNCTSELMQSTAEVRTIKLRNFLLPLRLKVRSTTGHRTRAFCCISEDPNHWTDVAISNFVESELLYIILQNLYATKFLRNEA